MDSLPSFPPVFWVVLGKGLVLLFILLRLAARRDNSATRLSEHEMLALRKGATVRQWKKASPRVRHSSAMMWSESLESRQLLPPGDHTDFAHSLVHLIDYKLESQSPDVPDSTPVHQIGWEIVRRQMLIAAKTAEAEQIVLERPAFLGDGALIQDWLVASDTARLTTTLIWVERLRREGLPIDDTVELAQVVRRLTQEQVGEFLEFAAIDTPLFTVAMDVLGKVRLAAAYQLLLDHTNSKAHR